MLIKGSFERLVNGFEEYQEKRDKIRRVHNFLVKAIEDSCRKSGVPRDQLHANIAIEMPIGTLYSYTVLIQFAEDTGFRVRIALKGERCWDPDFTLEGMSLCGLQDLYRNLDPMIGAAVKFCEEIGLTRNIIIELSKYGC